MFDRSDDGRINFEEFAADCARGGTKVTTERGAIACVTRVRLEWRCTPDAEKLSGSVEASVVQGAGRFQLPPKAEAVLEGAGHGASVRRWYADLQEAIALRQPEQLCALGVASAQTPDFAEFAQECREKCAGAEAQLAAATGLNGGQVQELLQNPMLRAIRDGDAWKAERARRARAERDAQERPLREAEEERAERERQRVRDAAAQERAEQEARREEDARAVAARPCTVARRQAA